MPKRFSAISEALPVGETSGSYELVLVRHGESEWNRDGRFAGWTDIDLTPSGEEQARCAGRLLAKEGHRFDFAITSLLKRSIRSQWVLLEELDQVWIPIFADWRLNERHYGALTGMRKRDAAQMYGEKKVFEWRRSYGARPDALKSGDPRDVSKDRRYSEIPISALPLTESLEDTTARVNVFWREFLAPSIRGGKRVIVCAHGNSLRALLKILDRISDTDIMHLDIPNAVPIIYWFDANMEPTGRCFLELPQETVANIL